MEGRDRVPREQYPWWVKFSLIGASSRQRQWMFVWLSLLFGVIFIVYGLFISRTGLGPVYAVVGLVGSVLSATMYLLTIRWVDRHGTWG